MKTLLAGTQALAALASGFLLSGYGSVQAAEQLSGSTGEGAKILDEHNRYRALHCDPQGKPIPALQWDDALAAYAFEWAQELDKTQPGDGMAHAMQHRKRGFLTGTSIVSAGENLAGWAAWNYDGIAAVKKWYDEINEVRDYKTLAFALNTGHVTQVVWAGTTKIGCATTGTSANTAGHGNFEILVCNYSPGGNMPGAFQTNVFPPNQCSSAP